MDIIISVLILGIAGYLVYRFLFKKKGKSCCSNNLEETE